jgi:hypothetical protein
MPMGPAPLGFAYFAGVKFVGYSAAALVLRRAYKKPANALKVGLARTGIGLVAGTLFGGASILISSHLQNNWPGWVTLPIFFSFLIPIRLAEWSLLIHFFFDRGLIQRDKLLDFAALGSLWSFVLDAVGIVAAFVVPGGFWIC